MIYIMHVPCFLLYNFYSVALTNNLQQYTLSDILNLWAIHSIRVHENASLGSCDACIVLHTWKEILVNYFCP